MLKTKKKYYLSKLESKISSINYYYSKFFLKESKYPKFLSKMYKKRTGDELNWGKIVTYNEKIQWAKLNDVTPIKVQLSDKLLVRSWIEEKIGKEYLIPLLGSWEKFEDIDFDKLPNQFVLKTNNGSGTNLIVKNKKELNKKEAKRKFDKWMKINFAYLGFEMQYKEIKPMIIAESYIEDKQGNLNDYKFLCFEGKVNYCWVDLNRFSDHRRNVYNTKWELQPWRQHYYENTDYQVNKPDGFDEMLQVASKLCSDFSHVRVDLYNVDGKIYFGEMTFTNGSGFEKIYPKEYSIMLGEMWKWEN